MKFDEFLELAFPIKDPFKRSELGKIHNAIKYLALRLAYVLFKLNVSANALDVFCALIVAPIFYLIYISVENQDITLFLLSFAGITFIIFVDFADGPLSQMSKYSYNAGVDLDNLCPQLVSWSAVVFIGYLAQNVFLFIISIVNVLFFVIYQIRTKHMIPDNKRWLLTLIHSQLSLLSVRVMPSLILPLLCIFYIYNQEIAVFISRFLVIAFAILSCFWMQATLMDKTERKT